MGRSGYLPDLSGVFNYWRKKYDDAMTSGDWDKASLALHNMNGTLEEEYRLAISNEMWEENKDSYIVWKCDNCTTKSKKIINKDSDDEYEKEVEEPTCSEYKDIETYFEVCTLEISILSGGKTKREMWICPKCKNHESVDMVKRQRRKHKSPHYRECIYEEPIKPNSQWMRRRGKYPAQMEIWAKFYSIELEHRLSKYRLEYVRIMGHDMEDSGYVDKGDK